MLPPACEDYLEAILAIVSVDGRPATLDEIAVALKADPATAERNVAALVAGEYLIRLSDGQVELTEKGRELADRVAWKHGVLQCFLTEMLGIDEDAASREACTLEHKISDDTVNRLSSYIESSPPCARPCERGRHGWRRDANLLEFEEGDTLYVTMIRQPGCNRRLIDLGLVPGQEIQLRRKLRNQAVVVRVKECDVAISPEIAGAILVEKRG
jgi:DtxR family transcriptional regulator, Mn-dependent transcriptional regulator